VQVASELMNTQFCDRKQVIVEVAHGLTTTWVFGERTRISIAVGTVRDPSRHPRVEVHLRWSDRLQADAAKRL